MTAIVQPLDWRLARVFDALARAGRERIEDEELQICNHDDPDGSQAETSEYVRGHLCEGGAL